MATETEVYYFARDFAMSCGYTWRMGHRFASWAMDPRHPERSRLPLGEALVEWEREHDAVPQR